MTEIKRVGIVGAGQMGNGIAHVSALAGYDVALNDISEDALSAAKISIEKNMARQVSKDVISPDDMTTALDRITFSTGMAAFTDVDLVIEAATENRELKEKIFKSLLEVVPERAFLATNTSSISITRLASVTDRPEKFIGVHFMNPVPIMKLVEIIRGLATDQDTYDMAKTYAERLGKTITNAEDYPAFIVNRILMPMINEAIYALYEGVGTVESIDTGMRLGANHPMGPLQLADFIGLDTCLSIMQVLYDGLADSKYRPCPLLVKYVEAGWMGRKVQRGFLRLSWRRACADAVDMINIRDLDAADRPFAVALWELCSLTVPWNDPVEDFNRAIANPTSKILGAFCEDELIATVMVGYEGHRGWVYYVAVAREYRRSGLAKQLMNAAEDWLRSIGAPKVMLMVREGNEPAESLYKALGYEISSVKTYGKFFD